MFINYCKLFSNYSETKFKCVRKWAVHNSLIKPYCSYGTEHSEKNTYVLTVLTKIIACTTVWSVTTILRMFFSVQKIKQFYNLVGSFPLSLTLHCLQSPILHILKFANNQLGHAWYTLIYLFTDNKGRRESYRTETCAWFRFL